MHVARAIDSKFDLARLGFLYGAAHIHRDGAGLWSRHETPGSENPTQLGNILHPGTFSMLGVGVPFATAAKLSHPRDTVIVISGDGAFLSGGLSVEAAFQENLPIVVVVDNNAGHFRPGQFVRANVIVATTDVPLAVKRSGLQRFRDFDVVFAQIGDTYEVRMLDLGRQDEIHVEVLGGIEPGSLYVTDNSYLIKADIEKSGASHDH